jgi:hypothetical protein
MSDAQRCEPPEHLRGVDGWHWVFYDETGPKGAFPVYWSCAGWMRQWFPREPDEAYARGYRYYSPVAPPDLVRALVEAVEAVVGLEVLVPRSYMPGMADRMEALRAALHRAKEAGV